MLFELGSVIVNDASPYVLVGTEKFVIVGVTCVTVNVAVFVPELYFSVAAWVAVMIELPAETIVIMLPEIVATEVLELV